jgi:hypothetical protein
MAADSCQHIYGICSKLLARAVAACRPSSSLQSVQQIAVTLRNKSHLTAEPQVSITSEPQCAKNRMLLPTAH